ncbi:MAG: EamA family transporter [Acidobacteria bacterium]|nr:EamA family transporter [Acidobacteriota bacterium]
MTQPGNHLRGAALVAAAALLWSSSGLFIKVLPLGPLQIAGARSLVAALVIAAAVHWRGGKPFPRPTGLDLACAAAYAAMLILFVAATKLTTAANAIFLQFSAPVYLVFLEPWATRRALQGRDLVAVLLCMGAMACFFGGRLEAGTLEGNVLGVLSGVMLAVFTLTLKLGRARHANADPITAIILGNLLVAGFCAPWALPDFHPTLGQGAALLYLGVFQIGLAYLLFNAGMRHLSATAAVVTGTLEAVLNPVWVFIGMGERPSPWALVGGFLILGTIAWYTLVQGPKRRPALP